MRRRLFAAALLSLSLGCADDPTFLPLASLCLAFASDYCDAQARCCGVDDLTACKSNEEKRCDAAVGRLMREDRLRYDAPRAASQREELRARLDACTDVPSLSVFFVGGLSTGSACARDAECASGRCAEASGRCAEASAEALCEAP